MGGRRCRAMTGRTSGCGGGGIVRSSWAVCGARVVACRSCRASRGIWITTMRTGRVISVRPIGAATEAPLAGTDGVRGRGSAPRVTSLPPSMVRGGQARSRRAGASFFTPPGGRRAQRRTPLRMSNCHCVPRRPLGTRGAHSLRSARTGVRSERSGPRRRSHPDRPLIPQNHTRGGVQVYIATSPDRA
jgi:hypothetical protein